jgi:DNA-directed RNA polymerase specialized sigma24 family protein
MSARRQSLANEESYEALQALFLTRCQGECDELTSEAVWRQVLDNPWFRAEVRVQAARLVGQRKLDERWCDEMAQNIVVQLRRKLSNKYDLGADADELRESFPRWMRKIIRNACIDTLRRESRHDHAMLIDKTGIDKTWQTDLRLDMLATAQSLDDLQCTAVLYNLQGYTIEATARVLGRSNTRSPTPNDAWPSRWRSMPTTSGSAWQNPDLVLARLV